MKTRAGIAQYEATIVLVVISLSLASVVYSGLKRESSLDPEPLFVNQETAIGGSPTIERLEMNSSSYATISSMSLDSASSAAGILAFNGTRYSNVASLCAPGLTTFFSVMATQAGALQVATDGSSWISGAWGASTNVVAGWNEIMIRGGNSCTVTLPGGQVVSDEWSRSSTLVSSMPVDGAIAGTAFMVYLPVGGGVHSFLVTSSGGFDDVPV